MKAEPSRRLSGSFSNAKVEALVLLNPKLVKEFGEMHELGQTDGHQEKP